MARPCRSPQATESLVLRLAHSLAWRVEGLETIRSALPCSASIGGASFTRLGHDDHATMCPPIPTAASGCSANLAASVFSWSL